MKSTLLILLFGFFPMISALFRRVLPLSTKLSVSVTKQRPTLSSLYHSKLFSSAKGSAVEWPVQRVRSAFVDYFVSKDHTNYRSSPCVPVNDPTLLFANAGMNQFKPIFVGTVDPSSPLASLNRAVNSQKCIRAGGKHNDLDDVGKDTYHHTFFEMLGTWSFGNYFKQEAIDWAYDILVNTYKLDPERMYVSYFGGDVAMGLPSDEEAKAMWGKYLPAERILPFDKKDNFWEMGETGPCGPCSEIHYDRIGGRNAASLVNADDPNVIEIWNLVFIQFNREPSGELRQLPNKHIDTGMGLERITSILQNKPSNYDTDVFMPIFRAIEEVVGCPPYTGKLGEEDAAQNYRDTAYRVVADHLRTLTFAITDGAVPSNEGRGYVLRRVLRRAVRYGIQTLGAKPGFFAKLVPVLVKEMGEAFPELNDKSKEAIALISEEEEAFSSLLERGVKYFNELMVTLKAEASGKDLLIDGGKAFFLYDSLGFPIDLTQLMADEYGAKVDITGFQKAMEEQKERSRVAAVSKRLQGRTALALGAEQVSYLQKSDVKPTDDSSKYSWDNEKECTIKAIYTDKGFVSDLSSISQSSDLGTIGIVLDVTTFYAEAGGQVADTGKIIVNLDGGKTLALDAIDTQIYGGYVLHTCGWDTESSSISAVLPHLSIGLSATAKVDYERRRKVAPNHTMTHVLNYALRQIVGEGVDQKGSLVSDEKYRFDFSLNRAMKIEEIQSVEELVNKVIRLAVSYCPAFNRIQLNDEGLEVSNQVVPLADAMKINGLRAVFGEVYPDPVRVLSIGPKVSEMVATPDKNNWLDYSVEFCGGTHLTNTKQAKAFVILEETAVAKGIRRLSGVTGDDAFAAIQLAKELSASVNNLEAAIKSNNLAEVDATAGKLRQSVEESTISAVTKSALRTKMENLQKETIALKNKEMMMMVDKATKELIEEVSAAAASGKKSATFRVDVGSDGKAVKRVMEEIKKTAPELSFLCVSSEQATGKVTIFNYVTDSTQSSGLKANEWIGKVLQIAGGRGGGKPGMAQGSCQVENIEGLDDVIKKLISESDNYLQSVSV